MVCGTNLTPAIDCDADIVDDEGYASDAVEDGIKLEKKPSSTKLVKHSAENLKSMIAYNLSVVNYAEIIMYQERDASSFLDNRSLAEQVNRMEQE